MKTVWIVAPDDGLISWMRAFSSKETMLKSYENAGPEVRKALRPIVDGNSGQYRIKLNGFTYLFKKLILDNTYGE